MKAHYKLALALLVGIVIGATGINVLHAKSTTPPGYIISEMDVRDPGTYQTFWAQLPSTLAPYKGRILVRDPKNIDVIYGTSPMHISVIAFDSAAMARRWVDSTEHQAIRPLRVRSAEVVSAFIVEGVAP